MEVAAEAYPIGGNFSMRQRRAFPPFKAGIFRALGIRALQSILRKVIELALAIVAGSGDLPCTRALRAMLDSVGSDTFETWRAVAVAPRQS